MANPAPRNVTPIIAAIRDFLGQRPIKNHLRWEQNYYPRNIPPARLPKGVHHSMFNSYYYMRDGRRESMPPILAYAAEQKKLASGEGKPTTVSTSVKIPLPGQTYNWDM